MGLDLREEEKLERLPEKTTRISDVYVNVGGRKFGAWIDADSRSNGYNENDLIENPAYIIESILRDELGLTSTNIDYASFDTVGNSSSGSRDGWKFGFSLNEKESSIEILKRLCYESHCALVYDSAGRFRLIALDTDTGTAYQIENSQIDEDPKIKFTTVDQIKNQFKIGYAYDYAEALCKENILCSESESNIGQYTNLLSNPFMEVDTSDWNESGASVISRNTTTPICGTGDLLINCVTGGYGYSNDFSITINHVYRVRCYYRKSAADDWTVAVAVSATGVTVTGCVAQTLSATTNTYFDYIFKAGATATCRLQFVPGAIDPGQIYLDNIEVREVEFFGYTSFTPNESSSLICYGGSSTLSLCGISQSRYGKTNLLEYDIRCIYDATTANKWIKKIVEWNYATKMIVELSGRTGNSFSTGLRPFIQYEIGDQAKLNIEILKPSFNGVGIFMVIGKQIDPNTNSTRLKFLQMR